MKVYFVHKGNELVYIGQTVMSLAQRRGKHYSEARKGRGSIFGAGIRKHGEDKFTWSVVAEFETQKECCDYEKKAISHFKPRYNVQCGGKLSFEPWNKGKKENRSEVKARISKSAINRKRTKRGSYAEEHVTKIREAKLRNVARPFKCLNNGKVYQNKVEAAEDLKIPAAGISLVLMPSVRNKTYYGYRFEYLAQNKSSLIDLESRERETGRKTKVAVND